MRLPWMGIFEHVLVIIFVAIGILLATLTASAIYTIQESTKRTMQERLLIAQTAAGRVDDRLDDIRRLIQDMAATRQLDPESQDRAEQARRLCNLRSHVGSIARYVALVDLDSNLVLVDPPNAEILEVDLASDWSIQRIFEIGTPVITHGLLVDKSAPAAAVIVPTKGANGLTNGAVFAALDLNDLAFADILRPLGLGSTGYTQIIDSTGFIIGSSRPEARLRERDHQGTFASLIANQETMIGTCHDCHASGGDAIPSGHDIIAFAPLRTAPWAVILRQSQEEVFALSNDLEFHFASLGLVAFALVTAITWLLTRRLVRPIAALTESCQKIADGDWTVAIPRNGAGELKQLAQAFELMRERLMVSTQRLEGWTAELEQAVYERTRDLEESSIQLCQANRRLAALNALGDALRASTDLDGILEIALDKVVTLANALGGCVCVFDEAKRTITACRNTANVPACSLCEWADVQPALRTIQNGGRLCMTDVVAEMSSAGEIRKRADGARMPCACIPLEAKGRNLGALLLIYPGDYAASPAELELLASLGGQTGIAIENAMLLKTVREKEAARGLLLRKVIVAQEEERRRVARELHDETSQTLTAVSVGLEAAIRAPAHSADQVKERLIPIKALSTGMLEEVQRMVRDLRPSLLDDIGLISAIDWYSEMRLKQLGMQVNLEIGGTERRLPTEVETTIFRLAQEAISNVAKHSGAENVNIALDFRDKSVIVEIEDDGRGFDDREALAPNPNNGSFGLVGMYERIDLFGGKLLIDSRPGEGTSVRIELPVPAL